MHSDVSCDPIFQYLSLSWIHYFPEPESLSLDHSNNVPGAELDAECSMISCAPSIFSLFSVCFFKVLVLEGSIGNRGKYGTIEEEDAVLPSSSATSVISMHEIICIH